MEEESFLSPKHSQLLNIAIWAKYLAWIVFVIYIIQTGSVIILKQIQSQQIQASMGSPMTSGEYWDHVLEEPVMYVVDVLSDMVFIFVRGAAFYVALKGISLGLYMIVETDINYREQQKTQEES